MSLKKVAPLALSILVVPSVALAQGKPVEEVEVARTGLDFKAPDGCPSAEEFLTKVQQRAEGSEFVESDADRTFVVKIEKNGSTYHGSFSVRGGGTTMRKVASENCTEVSDALAVVAALSLVPLKEEESETGSTASGATDSSQKIAESNLVADDEPSQQEGATGASKQKNGQAPGRNLIREKELKRGHTIGVDVQAGVTLGRYPATPAARFDLGVRTGAFLQISKNAQYLWGFVPRVRGNIQPLSRIRYNDYHVHVSGAGIAAGGCYTPYYDPDGFRVFGCLDFGANHMEVTALSIPSSDEPLDGEFLIPQYWTGVGTLSLESEFKIVSLFYGALRMGVQQETQGSQTVSRPSDGSPLLTLSGTTFIASGGIGAHF